MKVLKKHLFLAKPLFQGWKEGRNKKKVFIHVCVRSVHTFLLKNVCCPRTNNSVVKILLLLPATGKRVWFNLLWLWVRVSLLQIPQFFLLLRNNEKELKVQRIFPCFSKQKTRIFFILSSLFPWLASPPCLRCYYTLLCLVINDWN